MADRPNILLVFTDQQRHDTFTGNPQFDCVTPGMDYLARQGQKFTNAFCAAPICSPSRSTIMTGLYPTQAGMPGNLNAPSPPLKVNITTIGHRLQAAGYQCVYFGKWHLGGNPDRYGFTVGTESMDDPTTVLDARKWLRNHWKDRRPFFCVVSLLDPHDIYFLEPDDEQADGTPEWPSEKDDLSKKPWPQGEFAYQDNEMTSFTPERWKYYRDFYARKVEKVDGFVDQVVRGCFESGYRNTTWTIFTRDHGDMAGEHGIPFKGPFMYDGVTRVPLVIVPPRKLGTAAPAVHDVMTNNIDLVPTMLDMAGLPADESLPGRSLLPAIRGQGMDDPPYVLSEWIQKQRWLAPCRMVRTRQWKYVHYVGHLCELYDMTNDPHEMTNLIDDPACQKVREQLHAYLTEHTRRTGDPYFSLVPTDRQGNPFKSVD